MRNMWLIALIITILMTANLVFGDSDTLSGQKNTLIGSKFTSTKSFELKIEGDVVGVTSSIVQGYVKIPGAKLKCYNEEGLSIETTSDSNGHYVFEYNGPQYSPSPFSMYSLKCSAEGYSHAYKSVKTDSEVKATQNIIMFPYKQPSSKSEDSLYDEVVNNLHITIKGPKNPEIGKERDYAVLLEPIEGTGIIEGNLLFAYDDKYINLYPEQAKLFFKNPEKSEFEQIDLKNDYNYHDLNDFIGKETGSLLFGALFTPAGIAWDVITSINPDLKLPPKGSAFYDDNNYDIFNMPYKRTEKTTSIGHAVAENALGNKDPWDKDPSAGVMITLPIELIGQPERDLHFYTSWATTTVQGTFYCDSQDIIIPIEFDRKTKDNAFQLTPIQVGGQIRNPGEKATSHIITVGPSASDYSGIQAAIEAASPGSMILIHNGTYHENVNVTKQLILRGAEIKEKMPVIDGNGEKSAITLSADGITILGLKAINSGIGIEVGSRENTLVGNLLQNNGCGVYIKMPNNCVKSSDLFNNFVGITIDYAGGNILEGNSIQGNALRGIYLKNANDSNQILDNDIIDNFQGIYFEKSNNNLLNGNMVKNSSKIGIYLTNSSDNVIYKNIFINNKPQNVNDDGENKWYDGTLGNFFSDFQCTTHSPDGTCESIYNIPGGNNVDKYPMA